MMLNGFYRTYQLSHSHSLSSGYALQCSAGGKGATGYVDFSFKLNGKSINTSCALDESEISIYDCQTYLAGKYFPVIYNPDNPSNAKMLMSVNDFKKYGYDFPDSLHWVLNYIKKR